MQISVLINTFNEERNIKNCLESIKWADEIIVVDMYSDDKTVEIAKNYTDKIYFFERMGYADPARQYTLSKATNEWVLILDADEIVPIELRNKLIQIIDNNLGDVIYIPRNNYFSGDKLVAGGAGAIQDMQPRVFRKNCINLSDKIHDFYNISDDARVYKIDNPDEGFIHFSYMDYEHYIEKFNNYTSIEAGLIFDDKKKMTMGSNFLVMLFGTFILFIYLYIIKRGYKDRKGFSVSYLIAIVRIVTYVKFKLMQEYDTKNPREKILSKYQDIVDDVISRYDK